MMKLCGIFVLLAMTPGISLAGVVFVFQRTEHGEGGKQVRSRISIEGRRLRIDNQVGDTGQAEVTMIFLGDSRKMVNIDHQRKQYMVIDQRAMDAVAGQMNEAMAKLQEQLKNMPPERRAMVEKMMKGRMSGMGAPPPAPAPSKVVATGRTGSAGGYACEVYEVSRAGVKHREMCVTGWANIGGGAGPGAVMKDMAAFTKEMMSSVTKSMGVSGQPGNPLDFVDQVEGFPVSTRHFENGRLKSETVLESMEERSLDGSIFEPPAGYSEQKMGRR